MEKVYIVGPSAAARAKAPLEKVRQIYLWVWAVSLILLLLFLGLEGDWKLAASVVGTLLAVSALAWAAWRVGRPLLQKGIENRYGSFKLVVNHEGVTRHQAGLPHVTIPFPAISMLQEFPGNGLLISTDDPDRRIFVPTELVGYEELKAFLSQWRSPVRGSWQAAGAIGVAVGVVYAISWGIIRSSHDPGVVLAVASLLVAYMLWGLYKVWRTPELGIRGKLAFLVLEVVGLIEIFQRVMPYLG